MRGADRGQRWGAVRLSGLGIAVGAALGLAAPALACSPAVLPPSSGVEQGPNCSQTLRLNDYESAALGEVSDLGAGHIVQPLREGNACASSLWLVVGDCSTGAGLLIGPERVVLMDGPAPSKLAALDRSIRALGPEINLKRIAELAKNFEKRQYLAKDAALKFGEVTMPLDCGCKTAYPATKPRG